MFTAITGIGNSSSHLVHLDVSSNRLLGKIPDFFHSFPELSYFSAHSNNLSGGIPQSLLNSQTISTLNLRNNSLDGLIDFNCSAMFNLTSLDLGSNNFSGTIPANLPSCLKLKAINLASNKIIGQIPESFKDFQSLSYISLSNCSFSNLSASLKILQHCPNLTILVLKMNFYNEQFPFDDDVQFKALKVLVISNCRLSGSMPLWLNSVTRLELSFNHLTGSIPAYLGGFKSLFYLDLSNNFLSGEIPKNLTELQSLISREVLLEEASPDFQFHKSSELISSGGLTLEYNQIMTFGSQLNLSSNLLIGPIWPEFGNLNKLNVLDLKHNNLSGTIPSSLSGMKKTQVLDLSYNNLTGTIPVSLGRLYLLSKFSVAYNKLTEIIPSRGQLATFSASSFEGNPGLCGDLYVKCEKNLVLLQTPASENTEDSNSITRLLVFTGFGTGFLLSIFYLLVIPMLIQGYNRMDGSE